MDRTIAFLQRTVNREGYGVLSTRVSCGRLNGQHTKSRRSIPYPDPLFMDAVHGWGRVGRDPGDHGTYRTDGIT